MHNVEEPFRKREWSYCLQHANARWWGHDRVPTVMFMRDLRMATAGCCRQA
jgi:hypothetical protein